MSKGTIVLCVLGAMASSLATATHVIPQTVGLPLAAASVLIGIGAFIQAKQMHREKGPSMRPVAEPARTKSLPDPLEATPRPHSSKEEPVYYPAPVLAESGEVVRQSTRAIRVLLAEDNLVSQRLAARTLERLGCEVDIVENGEDAVRAVDAEEYDVVFMDCQMPGVDGYEATTRIRKLGHHSTITIIALTAETGPQERARCLAAGMDGYLSKPVRRSQLETVIDRLTDAEPLPSRQSLAPATLSMRVLEEEFGGDPDLVREIVHLYMQGAPAHFHELENAMEKGDAEGVLHAGNALRALIANFGAFSAIGIIRRLEASARQGLSGEGRELLPDLKRELSRIEKQLGRLHDEHHKESLHA